MFYCVIMNDTQAIFAYPTLREASEKFHTELAYSLNQNRTTTCVVMDKSGAVYKSEQYTAETAQE